MDTTSRYLAAQDLGKKKATKDFSQMIQEGTLHGGGNVVWIQAFLGLLQVCVGMRIQRQEGGGWKQVFLFYLFGISIWPCCFRGCVSRALSAHPKLTQTWLRYS